jgi:hypothetical protein
MLRPVAVLFLWLGTRAEATADPTAGAVARAAPDSNLVSALLPQWGAPSPPTPEPVPLGTPTGSWSASLSATRLRHYGSSARGAMRFDLTNSFALELGAAAAGRVDPGGIGGGALRSDVRARWGEANRGLWVGWGIERESADGGSTSPPLVGFGVWAQRRDIEFQAALEQTVEHLSSVESFVAPGDTLPSLRTVTRQAAATTASLETRWQYRRLSAETMLGVTLSRSAAPSGWLQSSVTLALNRAVAVYLTVGDPGPRWLALDPAAQRSVSAGLKLSQWTSALSPGAVPQARTEWDVVRSPHGRCTFQVRAAGAHEVEIIGDFTGWVSVPMHRVSGTRWELSMAVPAGVHQVNLRRDRGEWTPPPGLPTVLDGFNGVVGLLVID